MDLFEVVNKRVKPSHHALMIKPFSDIWENDESEDKEIAIKILSYIELLCSPKKSNPFSGYSDQDRPEKVKKEIWGVEEPKLNDEAVNYIIYGTLKYKELLENDSPSYALYSAGVKAVHKLKNFLENFDLRERSPHGAMVMKPRDITAALKELPEVEKSMQLGRDKVQSELMDSNKTRNQRRIGSYER